MRHPFWPFIGILIVILAAGLGGRLVFPPLNRTWPTSSEPPPKPPPYELVGPREFDERDEVILRYFGRHECGYHYCHWPLSAEEQQSIRKEIARRELEYEKVGGSPAQALALYLRLLRRTRQNDWSAESSILSVVAKIPGDRSAFRPIAVARLADHKVAVASSALRLLKEIGTAEDAAKVADLLDYYAYDFPGEKRDVSFFMQVVDTLAAIGTAAEIAKLDKARATFFQWDRDDFWARADACVNAIRRRHGLPERLPAPRRD